MKIREIIWFEEIIDKLIAKHGVSQDEVYQLFENKPRFRYIEKGHHSEEDIYAALGQTRGGRYLIAFFIYKKNQSVIIVSVREMTHGERKRYEKK